MTDDPQAIAARVAAVEAKARALLMLYNTDFWCPMEPEPRSHYCGVETDESESVCETNSEFYRDFIVALHNDCREILMALFPKMWEETRAQRDRELEETW